MQLKPWYIWNKHKEIMKDGEKKAEQLGTQGPKAWHRGELAGFSRCLIYPRLGAEEAGTQEMPIGTDMKDPNKRLLSLAKGPGKIQPSKTENLDSNHSTLAKQHRKNWGPIPPEGLASHPHETIVDTSSAPIWWSQRRSNRELDLNLRLCGVGGDHVGSLDFYRTQQ